MLSNYTKAFSLLLFYFIIFTNYSYAQIEFTEHVIMEDTVTYDVILFDLDEDGDMDIISAGRGIFWFENDGEQEFTVNVIYEDYWCQSIAIGDLDSDGDFYLATAHHNRPDFRWFENDGDQNFEEHDLYHGHAYEFQRPETAIIDFDEDGDNDILTWHRLYNVDSYLIVWENDGDGNFESHEFGLGSGGSLLHIVDVDNDQDYDVLGMQYEASLISYWENLGDYSSIYGQIFEEDYGGIYNYFPVEINSDSLIDIVASAERDVPTFWINQGDFEFIEEPIFEEFSTPYKICPADIDGDQDIDLFAIKIDSGSIVLLNNDGDLNFDEYEIAENDQEKLVAGDIDGDSDIDLLLHGRSLYWLESLLDPSTPEEFNLSAPQNFSTVIVNEVTLYWSEAADNDENDIISYHIDWSLDPDLAEENTFHAVTTDTTFTITELGDQVELPNDSTIYWRVYATDNFGLMTWANGDSLAWAFTIDLTPKPYNLMADLNDEDGSVNLTWEQGPYPVDIVDLIYDDGSQTGFTRLPDGTLATQFSPEKPCRLHSLSWLISTNGEGGMFNAEIYNWNDDEPSAESVYEAEMNGLPVTDGEWITLDLYNQRLNFDDDFIVGFGSIDNITSLGIDANDDNGRSWELSGGNWSPWTETYFIRANVQYTDSRYDVLAGEIDDFIRYKIYRDGDEIGRSDDPSYTDELAGYGSYEYTVISLYDDGESEPAGPLVVNWTDITTSNPSAVPERFEISSVYPNPFNSSTTISIGLPASSELRLSIYNITGQKVAVLANEHYSVGYYQFTFNADELSTGIYFIYASVPGKMDEVRKIVLLR
ncbi:MAG: T9SS type A sorting domain-containing protein [Candidatus Electryonea clarkiae]|nr:T9SS type A sorting domain-containing protein [Candidatus Electryonea clarkiae]MDP8286680.1 T9SS type A sorting domain-containing protein [Candidatus Electryonea clarkiae]